MFGFNNDEVTIIKSNGSKADGIMACIQPDLIVIDVEGNKNFPPIEAGDIISHAQSNGITEQYKVLDPCYYDDVGSFDKHYQCSVKKLSAIERQKTQNIFNINANQANIATDNATTNSVQKNGLDFSNLILLIELIKKTIPKDINSDDLEILNDSLETFEAELKNDKPKKGLIRTAFNGLNAIKWSGEFGILIAKLLELVSNIT